MLDQYTPDQLTAFWSGVTGVVAVITGSVAVLTFRSLKQDSIERSRPIITVEVLPLLLVHGTCELVVQNVGQTVAKDVRVTFDPPVTEDMGRMAGFLARRYAQPIPTMAPRRRLTNVYGRFTGDGTNRLNEPVPSEFTATAKYIDANGRRYEDSYALSLDAIRNETTSTPANTDERGMRRRAINAAEAIARGLNRL